MREFSLDTSLGKITGLRTGLSAKVKVLALHDWQEVSEATMALRRQRGLWLWTAPLALIVSAVLAAGGMQLHGLEEHGRAETGGVRTGHPAGDASGHTDALRRIVVREAREEAGTLRSERRVSSVARIGRLPSILR